jgi:trehalose utilization protein
MTADHAAADAREYRELTTAADVTPDVLEDAEQVLDGWFSGDERIDWEDFLDRLVKYANGHYDFPEYDNPAVKKVQRHVRKLRES